MTILPCDSGLFVLLFAVNEFRNKNEPWHLRSVAIDARRDSLACFLHVWPVFFLCRCWFCVYVRKKAAFPLVTAYLSCYACHRSYIISLNLNPHCIHAFSSQVSEPLECVSMETREIGEATCVRHWECGILYFAIVIAAFFPLYFCIDTNKRIVKRQFLRRIYGCN